MALPKPKEKAAWTYRDYLTLPEGERLEIIDGETFDMPPGASTLHQRISLKLLRQLGDFFDGRPCEVFHPPFDVRLPKGDEKDEEIETIVQPDIVVICDPGKIDERGCRGAPDLVVEILSPSTSSKDSIKKRRLYERHGVREFWIVDTTNKLVTVYRLDKKGRFEFIEIFDRTATIETPLFPGLAITLEPVFPPDTRVVTESPRAYRTGRKK